MFLGTRNLKRACKRSSLSQLARKRIFDYFLEKNETLICNFEYLNICILKIVFHE